MGAGTAAGGGGCCMADGVGAGMGAGFPGAAAPGFANPRRAFRSLKSVAGFFDVGSNVSLPYEKVTNDETMKFCEHSFSPSKGDCQ